MATELLNGASREDTQVIKNVLDQISKKQKKTRNERVFVAIILGGIIIVALSQKYNATNSNGEFSQRDKYISSPGETNATSQENSVLNNNTENENESVPPLNSIGTIFDRSQIRYCLMQSIRIEAAKNSVSEPTEYQIDQINALVNDYNSRCSNFRYRERDMAAVKQEIAQITVRLRSEGEALLNGGRN